MDIEATVFRVKRLQNSRYGNPRWELHTDRGVFRTQEDGQVGYWITDRLEGRKVRLLGDRGRVYKVMEVGQ